MHMCPHQQQQLLSARAVSSPSHMPRGSANSARRPSSCPLLPVNRHHLSALQLATSLPQISTCLRRNWKNQIYEHQIRQSAKLVHLHYSSPIRLFDLTHYDHRQTLKTSWKPTAAAKHPSLILTNPFFASSTLINMRHAPTLSPQHPPIHLLALHQQSHPASQHAPQVSRK
jgi:hypothetical protein